MQLTTFHSDYSRFSDEVWHWQSVKDFSDRSELRDGIHQIGLSDGSYFDLLLRGISGSYEDLAVFFNGAVVRDGTNPPYFSGSNVAVAASVPVIAVADPTLNLSSDLGIGWYTDGVGSRFESALVGVLRFLSNETGARLLMVGGSAGGFAALHFGTILSSSALVWNPQIDFLKYNPDHVRKYLVARFGELKTSGVSSRIFDREGNILTESVRRELKAVATSHEIDSLEPLDRLIYLQNKSDNHEKIHARPIREKSSLEAYADGIYCNGDKTMLVADFNIGHRAPSRELITYALKRMLLRDTSTKTIARDILNDFKIQV